jgi:hypothetical protein
MPDGNIENNQAEFVRAMNTRLADEENVTRRIKGAATVLLCAVLNAKPESLPKEVREARERVLQEGNQL